MGDEPLERIGAAAEEGERRPHVTRRVVEGAVQRHLLVVDAVRVDLEAAPRAGGRRRRAWCRRAGRARAPSSHASAVPAASITTSAPSPVARLGAEERGERPPLRPRADADRPAAGIGDARAEHQPDRPEPDHGDGVAGRDACRLDAVQAACERLHHRRELRRAARRDGEEVRPRDPLGDEDELGVGAVEQREEVLAERLLSALAGRAGAARRRVRGDDASAGARRRRRRTRVRRGSAAGRAAPGGRGGTPSGRCRR